jgi:2-C-methyl-D-erythritol 4-phosphate cytidylyltransferase
MRYWLVMPAAGAGRRFDAGRPKQYAPLAGRTVIEWALAPFLADARCAHAVVVIAPGDPHWGPVGARLGRERVSAAGGGVQRSHSVRLGLAALEARADAGDWVLVHDAARPCLDPADLARLLEAASGHEVGGLLATPAADTLKRAGSPGRGAAVAQTLDRSDLWRALTPQMFRFARLCAALDRAHAAGRSPSDEAEALEWAGEHPLLVEGASTNLKITAPADLLLAAAVLGARSGAASGRVA